jgi:DNA primase
MPGIDFQKLRAEITMEQVLELIGFEPSSRHDDQWYGPCPLHDNSTPRCRVFSVNVHERRYYCHRCRSHGNQLELWAAVTHRPLYPAAIDLCQRLGIDTPWIRRW